MKGGPGTETAMRWQREYMRDNPATCASAVKTCPACSHKPRSPLRLRAQMTAAEDTCTCWSCQELGPTLPLLPAAGMGDAGGEGMP